MATIETTDDTRNLSVGDVAKYWKISINSVRRLVMSGRLQGIDLSPPGSKHRLLRFSVNDLKQFERGDQPGATSDNSPASAPPPTTSSKKKATDRSQPRFNFLTGTYD